MTLADRAREIADGVLLPAALAVDAAERVPASHLDALAAAGLYGVAADEDIDFAGLGAIVEALASGDMSTALVWIQHLTPVMALLRADTPLSAAWLPALVAGERRGDIALAGIRAPQDHLRVRQAGGGFVLNGTVPWVTGWGMIDVVYTAARDGNDIVHFLLVDAIDGPTLRTETQRLVALQASNTVNVTFDQHVVPAERLVSTRPFDEWRSDDSAGSGLNGFLALGVVGRCVALLEERAGTVASEAGTNRLAGEAAADHAGADPAPADHAKRLAAAADRCRSAILADDPVTTPAARAAASELAWRAAGTLLAWTGARSVLQTNHAQRLAREAIFTMVFGLRPAIRDALVERLRDAT
jgi:alkylation response protein AidB-like acyl-CoA dehydrogenase